MKIDPNRIQKKILMEIAKVVKKGGIIIYPTETVYGIGADIFNKKAVERVCKLKKRKKKPISIALSSIDEIKKYASLNRKQFEFIKKNLPGPVTVILNKKNTVPNWISEKKIGIRIPEYKGIRELVKLTGPITSTSANVSGKPAPYRFKDIKIEVDLKLDGEVTKYKKPSMVIDLTKGEKRLR